MRSGLLPFILHNFDIRYVSFQLSHTCSSESHLNVSAYRSPKQLSRCEEAASDGAITTCENTMSNMKFDM